MAASSYDEALKGVLEHEGGNDDDPRDPGGRTSRGILQSEWNAWRRTHPVLHEDGRERPDALPPDVWDAPADQIKAIYRQQYWSPLCCDDLPAGVDYCVFDYGVNSGTWRSAKMLQRALHVPVDGMIGPQTIGAAKAADPKRLINAICDERLAFLRDLSTWPTFGRGWGTRVADVRRDALAMADTEKETS